jgi:hypothetical protein
VRVGIAVPERPAAHCGSLALPIGTAVASRVAHQGIALRTALALPTVPRRLLDRQGSTFLLETATRVVCRGFAESVWMLEEVPANETMPSTYFVLEHPSGATRR